MNMIEKMVRAIEECGQHRLYGFYDYSSYNGTMPPHVVKNEKTREELFRSFNREKAEEYWRNITQTYVAKAAILAMREPSEGMKKFEAASGDIFDWDCKRYHCGGHKFAIEAYIDAALKE